MHLLDDPEHRRRCEPSKCGQKQAWALKAAERSATSDGSTTSPTAICFTVTDLADRGPASIMACATCRGVGTL